MPKSQLLFSAVFGFRNPSKEIFSELDEINAQGPIFARSFQKTEEITKWGHEAARGQGGAAQALAARPYPLGTSCGPPRCPSAYLKSPSRNPQYREPRYGKPSRDAAAANPISGDSGDRLRHPAGEGIHLPEDSSSPWSPPEWWVSSSPLDYGSIAVARWSSSPCCASLLDLVSCLTWSRSSICNSICCVCWDPMNREYLLCWLSKLCLCVVYDLACSPLLVEALAKFLLLTPRGSIYAR